MATLVQAMTAKSKAARPASYPDLLRSLTPAGAVPAPLDSATSTMPKGAKRIKTRARPVYRWIAAAAMLAVIVAGLGLGWGRSRTRHGSFAVAVAPF